MAISDHIAVMASHGEAGGDEPAGRGRGRIEQVGGPRELYDRPANRFVMGFLGPVSQVGEQLVRPHDIEISLAPADGARQAEVTRVVHLGFEVRVELRLESGGPLSAQVTRHEAEQLELVDGGTVWVRTTGRTAVPA